MAPRYAIYHVPPANAALTRFGSTLLGYDVFSATDLAQPSSATGLFSDWHDLTSDPRKYGFHATLKAPFLLRENTSEADLVAAFDRFVAAPRAVPVIAPVVRAIGGFIAIVPDVPVAALSQLAADCVKDFEPLRAPLSAYDRERRLKSPLTARQIEHLDRWGYPYVFEEFRFHMTLTGGLPAEKREVVLPFLQGEFAKLALTSMEIGHIAIFKQASSDQRFTVLRHGALKA